MKRQMQFTIKAAITFIKLLEQAGALESKAYYINSKAKIATTSRYYQS